ncbi:MULTISPECIES: DinB family protein [Acidobacteriaceae]|uniref:DinB family protein n=1 Tax=Acidobacteriaceae TaxID=204434 RepID=UPI00131C0DD8|nr:MULTISPECIES: DinB family protein [Acidobacteriaceae]MDW5267521.1 DinB family protein [Edaphobacter sp.]
MSLAESLFTEFETQAPITRMFLERLPENKLTWKPHERSMTAGQLALHLARVPEGVVRGVQQNPAQAPDFNTVPEPRDLQEILQAFEQSIVTVQSVLLQFDDDSMRETWRLMHGDQELIAMPRAQFLREIMLNHWYQHRGQFSVYLRMLNVAVPASWGPSADETDPAQGFRWVQRLEPVAG